MKPRDMTSAPLDGTRVLIMHDLYMYSSKAWKFVYMGQTISECYFCTETQKWREWTGTTTESTQQIVANKWAPIDDSWRVAAKAIQAKRDAENA